MEQANNTKAFIVFYLQTTEHQVLEVQIQL